MALQCHNYDHDSIFRQVLTVTEYDISHIANAKSVYEDRTCMNASCHLGILSVQLQNNITDWGKIKTEVKDALGEYLWKRTKRNPMILPIIMEA